MRFTIILKYIGVALLLEAVFMFISAAVSAFNGFDEAFMPLLFSGVVTALLGAYPNIFVRGGRKLSSSEGYYIVVGSWVLCCLMGMLPYIVYGQAFSFTDALFESVSGFTTTGASILNDIETLPNGLLFWRMSTAWIGGIGIVALFSLIVPSHTGNDHILTGVEVSEIARYSSGMKTRSLVHIMIGVYLTLTLLAVFSLRVAGMGWFDSITHAMSACSTCGFSTKNLSIAAFDSPAIEGVLIVFMLLSSIRFVFLFMLITGREERGSHRGETAVTFLAMVLVGFATVTAGLVAGGVAGFRESARMALFQVASIYTTTGFATTDTNVWPTICVTMLFVGSFACGCSGSTSGGLKTDRFLLAIKVLWNRVIGLKEPNSIQTVRIDGCVKGNYATAGVMVFITTYFFIIVIGAILNIVFGLDMKSAWTASVACMGNVGPGFGCVGSMSNYADLPVVLKWSSMLLMIVGRLEIFPFLYVLGIRRMR